MKKMVQLIFILFTVVCSYSCEKDSLIEEVAPLVKGELKTRASSTCNGTGDCLPIVEFDYDRHSVGIHWTFKSDYNDHQLFLSLYGADGYVSKSERITLGGTWNYYIPDEIYNHGYKLTYQIKCYNSGCTLCSKSEVLNKAPGDNNPPQIGSATDCFKKFLSYSISRSSSTVSISLTSSRDDLENVNKFMQIKSYKVYELSSRGYWEPAYSSGSVITWTPYLVSLDFSSSEQFGSYQVRFFNNTECEKNELHYLYFNYYYLSPEVILRSNSLELFNKH